MRSVAVIVGILVSIGLAGAQQARPVKFTEDTFDFGNVIEEDGPVTHEFILMNNSTKPVTVLAVKPSCGCTTPEWTRTPIMPGKTGTVKAQFDPKGRPGYFNKSLTVTTDFDAQPMVVYIKGQVGARNLVNSSEYQAVSGNWKLRSLSFNLGKVYRKNEFVMRNIDFVNAGTEPISFLDKADAPPWINVNVQPKTVNPGQRGEIKLGYNGKLKNLYGFQSDKIVIHTSDALYPEKEFTIYVTLEDYFPLLRPEEIAQAPQLRIHEMTLEMGNIREGQTATREVSITNTGKSVLEIRAVQGNCPCVVASAAKGKLQPGESSTLKVELTPQDRKGTQTKSVVVYSNDPQNPVQRITLGAFAE
jgi:hypothetical protein